ncbi:MAG: VapC toxin family domain ribonuclease [Rhizobacter sp.]|nr:VapC toxin family domain ribonuclease [Rhizobacter sp.]
MIGLDTNVIVRYIMQDDAKQSAKATRFIEALTPAAPGFVTLVCLIEIFWVLSSSYALTREQIGQVLDALLSVKQLVVAESETIVRALRVFNTTSADFADCLIERGAAAAGCIATMTFDVKATKVAGMTLIQ